MTEEEAKAMVEISIHTPARGVTLSGMAQSHCGEISIHTPARGVTELHPSMMQ